MKNSPKIFVQVLQNGEILSEISRPFNKYGDISLSSMPSAKLSAPFYPLSHDIKLINITKRGAELELPPGWEGYTTHKGKLENFSADNKSSYTHIMQVGDYGSLALNDLQVLIRIGKQRKLQKKTGNLDKRFRGSLTSLIWCDRNEILAFGTGALISIFMFSCIVWGLLIRPNQSPTNFLQLDNEYTLPFIHPNHIKHHPEALQNNLDRSQPIHSIIAFVKSFSSIVTNQPVADSQLLFKTTVETYKGSYKNMRDDILQKSSEQKELESRLARDSTYALVSIPTVLGETFAGSILRLKDKFEILHENYAINLQKRKDFLISFRKDPIYEYGKYKNLNEEHFSGKKNKNINFFSQLTNEESMYQDAADLASEARFYQHQIQSQREKGITLNAKNSAPIGVRSANTSVSFIVPESFGGLNFQLKNMDGSHYNNSKKKIREPLIGKINPTLIKNAISKNKFQLQLCFELALRRNQGINGIMTWNWVLDSRGKIIDLKLKKSSINDSRMIRCVRNKIASWKFPRPQRGSVEIQYPFQFEASRG